MGRGCPGIAKQELGLINPFRQRKVLDLSELIERTQTRIELLNAEMNELTSRAETTSRKLKEARRQILRQRKPLQERIESYRRIERLASAYRTAENDLERLRSQIKSVRQQVRESLDVRKESDRRYKANRELLNQKFSKSLSLLLGQSMEGVISVNANGIIPQPCSEARSAGTALGTASTFAFDLACLSAAIDGLGYHPRFRVHDSPGTADMEPTLYHRLFTAVLELEQQFDGIAPSFQYIITTTTPPPPEMRKPPYIRLTLDGRTDDGFLLGRGF